MSRLTNLPIYFLLFQEIYLKYNFLCVTDVSSEKEELNGLLAQIKLDQ